MDSDIPVRLANTPPTCLRKPLHGGRRLHLGCIGQPDGTAYRSLPTWIGELAAQGKGLFETRPKRTGIVLLSELGLAKKSDRPWTESNPALLLDQRQAVPEPILRLVEPVSR